MDLDKFVKESTKDFDESHNWEHAERVYQNSINIMKSLNIEYDEELLTYAAKLHDVRDHKYPGSIPEDELHDFIYDNLGEEKGNKVIKLINNISYSKEIRGKTEKLDDELNVYLTVLRDADRLDAIGKIGIKRCEIFTLKNGGKVPEDVVIHCHDKLLKLYRDGFIKTPYARDIAKYLHNEVENYVLYNS